jgi:hypothetical protein
MSEAIDVPRFKDETSAQLKGIFAEFVLPMSTGLGPFAGCRIVLAQEVKDSGLPQARSLVDFFLFVDQQRELDAGVVAKLARVVGVAQTNGYKLGAFFRELLFVLAQLRDMLAAEDSSIVAQKHHHGRSLGPQRTQLNRTVIGVGQRQAGQLAAERLRHARHCHSAGRGCQARSRRLDAVLSVLDLPSLGTSRFA